MDLVRDEGLLQTQDPLFRAKLFLRTVCDLEILPPPMFFLIKVCVYRLSLCL